MVEWEEIPVESKNLGRTCRLKVPGGWLVRHEIWGEIGPYDGSNNYGNDYVPALGLCFMPDREHEWNPMEV